MTNILANTRIPVYYGLCGYPLANSNDLEAWNELDVDSGTSAKLSLGLFGYDITCLANLCSSLSDYYGYCSTIFAKGFDGLALGAHAVGDSTATATNPLQNWYGLGIRDELLGDKLIAFWPATTGWVSNRWFVG
jgi:hypothetical protein